MNCPACDTEMAPFQVGPVTLDVCSSGCGGIWFDRMELKRVDEPHEVEGSVLEKLQGRPGVVVDPTKRHRCPRCPDIVLMRHFFRPGLHVEVDECPNCGGYFLDQGELARIRAGIEEPDEQRQATREYYRQMAAAEIDETPAPPEERSTLRENVRRLFRFLSWLPD